MSKWAMGLIIGFIVLVLGFFIVSLILASVHGQDIVSEWLSWSGNLKETVEEPLVETAKVLFLR